jgi:hypothetical protein
MVSEQKITVEVAYALPDKQMIIPVTVDSGTTVYEAAVQSGIADHFDGIDFENDKMGIFSKTVRDPKTEVLKAGDRVEIYRPLLVDPKASRLKRAEKARRSKEEEQTQADDAAG